MKRVVKVWDLEHRNSSDVLQALHAAIRCVAFLCNNQ